MIEVQEVENEEKDNKEELIEVTPEISIHALLGSISFQIMRIKGRVRIKTIQILIDYGSSHNFLDEMLQRS